MSTVEMSRPRLACAIMLAASIALCIASVIVTGIGWRTIVAVAMLTSSVVHALSVPGDRASDTLRHWRMAHVALMIVTMNAMTPADGMDRAMAMPMLALIPLVAMATIRQMVGRSAALVPLQA